MKKVLSLLLLLTLLCGLAVPAFAGEEAEAAEADVTEETAVEETAAETAYPSESIEIATNQDDAPLFPLDVKIYGTVPANTTGWYSFHTADDGQTEYEIRAVNKSVDSNYLGVILVDSDGEEIGSLYADNRGGEVTGSIELAPDTDYYLRVFSSYYDYGNEYRNRAVDYALIVFDKESAAAADAVWGTGEWPADESEILASASNQDDAPLIPLNEKFTSTVDANITSWYAFRTAPEALSEYEIRAVNKSTDSNYFGVVLVDEHNAEELGSLYAANDGTATTFRAELTPDTVYYLYVFSSYYDYGNEYRNRTVDYSLVINVDLPDGEAAEPAAEALEEELEPAEDIPFGVSILQGEEERSPIGYTVGNLIELGFETEADVSEPVSSRVVCEVFAMTKDGIPFTVRAVNPYGDSIPLNDCIVCYFGISDTTGIVTIDGDISCGSAGKDDVVGRYPEPLVDKDTYVVYQTQNPERDYGNAYGNFVISEDVRTCDVLFRFDDGGTLSEVVFLAPYLLYNTLAENLDDVDVGAVDPVALDEAAAVRDDILERLRAAFEAEGIDVAIDEETGKITLDTSIMFEYDSYELSDNGKANIDSFLRAYAEALLDGEHASEIKTVQFDGHTDTEGSHEYNQTLSENRANAVLSYCTGSNDAGLTEEQTAAFRDIAVAVGHAYDDPIYDSDGQVDMEASRRVEIKFFLNIEE